MLEVTLPDGSKRSFEESRTVLQVAESIGKGLARAAVAGYADGRKVELSTPLDGEVSLQIVTKKDPRALEFLRHTAAHVMADAVQRLYPETRLAFGPPIDDGFYYDFQRDEPFTPDDFAAIEAKMAEIVKEDLPLQRVSLSPAEAKARLEQRGEQLKAEYLDELAGRGEDITFYVHGDFEDLCAGGHVVSTGALKAFKLQRVSGSYWRGDAQGQQLQRIYGTAFFSQKDLDEHLRMLEEAAKRDHRKLGPQLKLFLFREEAPSIPFYLPGGVVAIDQLVAYSRELQEARGYREIRTPQMLVDDLWRSSGHYDNYKENMYFIDDAEDTVRHLAVKPMNCPGHVLVYKSERHSYRDLPLRLCEYGVVHRREMSGVVHGLFRVRGFTQDDAHIFCTPEQIQDEIVGVIELVDELYGTFGFDYRIELSTRPEKSLGSDEIWETAESSLAAALQQLDREYQVNEGDGAFYGPKIDFHITDSLKRSWQCGTVQVDFSMPSEQALDCKYVGADNQFHTPVMIHRAIFGSIERFFGILIEHFGGDLPLWMAPVQVRVLGIADEYADRVHQVHDALRAAGLRSEVDLRNEKVGFKIREATLAKVPYMVVIGASEVESGQLAVRERRGGKQSTMDLDAFVAKLTGEVASRAGKPGE